MKEILVVDNESLHTQEIAKLFPGKKITVCPYYKLPDVKKYDLIVLSGGSHYSVLQKPFHYKKEIALIKNTSIPILGICLGCQLIAYAFGSSLVKMSEKLTREIEIRNGLDQKNYKVYESHKYAISTLGGDLRGVSKSIYGYEIIRHKTKPIWGFQFHPEVDMKHTEGKKILKEVLDMLF